MNSVRIFVSGGAGIIGKLLVQALIETGANVFVGDLKPCPKEWQGKIQYRQGDLNTITSQELQGFDPEMFFHLAAPFERSQETFSFWEEVFYNNISLSHHLLHCIKDCPSLRRVLFTSSYLVYDLRPNGFSETVTLKEDMPVYPYHLCGAAKLFHEYEMKFLSSFFKEPISLTSVRIFPVYSETSMNEISHWVRAAKRQETLAYHPLEKVDYISAENAAEGLIRLAQIHFNGTVNLGTGQSISSQRVIEKLKEHVPHLKTEVLSQDAPFWAFQADMELFHQLTGWIPPYDLESALPKMLQERHSKQDKQDRLGAVLVTSISKKVPLLQAVRRAAEKLGQFNAIHGCDSDQNCIGQYEVDAFWHTPPLTQLTIETIIAYCLEHRIKAIVPTRNADLEFYAKHAAMLQEKGIKAMVSDRETIQLCVDKKRFADFLIENHFPAIPTFLTIQECESKAYVVKERYGAGSMHMVLNVSKEQAISHANGLSEPIFQPYIAGQEWSVDLYRTSQGKIMGCVARQRNIVTKGESQVTTTAAYPELENLCESVAHRLGIEGHAVIQVIEDEEGNFHLIECNPRFGGASTASLAVGLDSFYWFLLECLGQNLQGYPFIRSKQEVRQVRYAADWILPWS